jgi:transposase InsO family protein
VAPWRSAPYHPQTHGKNERFNRTLNAQLLDG